MCKNSVLGFVILYGILTAITPLYAVPIDLVIFNNSVLATDTSLKFTVEALDGGAGKVDFLIKNLSTMNSTIANIYFDGDYLSSISKITCSQGTKFSIGATPSNLPGSQKLPFIFKSDFSVGATPPPSKNGIDPGESITVRFNLLSGHSSAEIISQLNNGDLRIGAHIISVGPNKVSVSAVTPEPVTIGLLGLGGLLILKQK